MLLITFAWTFHVINSCPLGPKVVDTPPEDTSAGESTSADSGDSGETTNTDDTEITIAEEMKEKCADSLRGMVVGSTGLMLLLPAVMLFIITIVALLCFK